MSIEDTIFLINFEKDKFIDILMDDEDELVLDENRVLSILREEGLSLDGLDGSTATIQNFKKQLYIKIENNSTVYPLSLLNHIGLPKFIKLANTFLDPKKILLSEVSPQIGGIIDTNYGIKFKIDILKQQAEHIYKEDAQKKANHNQANMYIRSILGILNNDDEYSPDIDDVIIKMRNFYLEGLTQIKHIEHHKNSDIFNIFYSKEDMYYFASYKSSYYAAVSIEDAFSASRYLIYHLPDNEVEIICQAQSKNLLHRAIESYFIDLENGI